MGLLKRIWKRLWSEFFHGDPEYWDLLLLTTGINNVYTYDMEAKIQKWGNSLGIRIPMSVIRNLALENGAVVDIEESGDSIIIKPKQNLDDLLSCITEDNIHNESDFGSPEGNEVW